MASPFPRPSSGKASVVTRSNGVLAIPASATQKRTSSMKPFTKVTAPRMKILIRRLPPGLTSTEFENGLGEEWRATGERVDWVQFKPGKVSKEYGEPFTVCKRTDCLTVLKF